MPAFKSRVAVAALSSLVVALPLAAFPAPGWASAGASTVRTEQVTLALAPSDPAGLEALAQTHGISSSQRATALAKVVPSASAHAKAESAAHSLGLTVTGQSLWAVHLSGSATLIQKYFGSSRGNDPKSPFGHSLPKLPSEFGGVVRAAFGGDETRPVATHSATVVGGQHGTGGLAGADLENQYGVSPGSSRAAGETIATVQLSDWNASDLSTYAAGESLNPPGVNQYTGVKDPFDPPSIDSGGSVEVDLDQEALYAVAPQANQRAYLSGNDGGGLYDDITAIGNDASDPITDHHITAASISWGLCEDTTAGAAPFFDAMEQALQYVLATGVTVFASTGDNGTECDPTGPTIGQSYPATSPEVVAVGGTEFTDPNATTVPTSEEVWNQGGGVGGAGGVSSMFFQPSWQVHDSLSETMRTVPDISSLAGHPAFEAYTTTNGAFVRIDGTSLASPTSAALFTDVLAEHGYTWGIGDIHANLYSKATYTTGTPTFTDITSGTIANGTDTAGPGYDLVTGWGTPLWENLVPQLGGDPHLSVPSPWIHTLSTPITVDTADFQDFTGYRVEEDTTPQCGAFGLSTNKPTSADFSFESPADGWHYMEVLAVDSADVCHWAYHFVFLDTHAPTVHPRIGLTSVTSGSQVTASWSFSDPAPSSGLNHFVVSITNQSNAVVYSTPYTTSTSKIFAASQGSTYTVSVRAVDNAGNVSPVATAKYAVPIDDTHFAFSPYWSRGSNSSAYGGSYAYSAHAGASTHYTATARVYTLWFVTSTAGGHAYVYVGSTAVKNVDLYATSTHWRVPVTVYSSTTLASRTITVKVSGVKDAASHGSYVYVDALQASA